MVTRTTDRATGVETSGLNELLRRLVEKQNQFAPDGWFSIEELCNQWGKSRRYVDECVLKMVKAGIMERKKFIARDSKRMVAIWHYAETSR